MIPSCSESKRVVFLCDAGPQVGGGHVMRCLTLAGALAARGWRCAFIASPEVGAVLDAFAPDMARVDGADGADVLVVDHYGVGVADETALRARAGKLVVLDDVCRPHDCDLVVDSVFGRRAQDYASPCLAGPRYALVRPEFAARRDAALARRGGDVRRALVSLGLTDVGGVTARVARALPEGVALDVVVGARAPSLPALETLAAEGRIALHVDTRDMAALMAAADVAVGAGGSSVWERACLGLPAVALILADNQREMTMKLEAAGATLALDARWPGLEERLAGSWRRLVADAALRASLSAASAALCDGLGADRVAEAIASLPV